MARFGGLVGVARATIPSGVEPPKWDEPRFDATSSTRSSSASSASWA